MSRFIITTIIITFLAVAFLITAKNSDAGIGFLFGPDGKAYKLIDCTLPENIDNTDKCPGVNISPNGFISWNTSRGKAQGMTFEGFPCDLATPSTEEVNNFLKNFPGFLQACNGGVSACSGFDIQLCAWFGARDPTLTEPPGPFLFVNDQNNDIPCPFAGDCDPVVIPGVGSDLTFQDWCRVATGCGGNEPNGTTFLDGQFFLAYLSWPNLAGGPVGWADCKDFNCVNSNCQPSSYFVQCELPLNINLSPPTSTNPVLTDHTVTATVEVNGLTEAGILVSFEVISGPNAGLVSIPNNGECSPNDDCTTDANGQVSWTYTGIKSLGTDTIIAMVGSRQSEPAEKIWAVFPIPTLSIWGLIALAGILGIVGFMVIRRRRATA